VFAPRSDTCGLATRFGASTVTGGIVAAEPVGICDAAGAHSKIVDKAAMVEGTTRLDENLMTMSFQIRDGHSARQVHGNIHFEAGNRGLIECPSMTRRASSALVPRTQRSPCGGIALVAFWVPVLRSNAIARQRRA
jgi:hypothetical protein